MPQASVVQQVGRRSIECIKYSPPANGTPTAACEFRTRREIYTHQCRGYQPCSDGPFSNDVPTVRADEDAPGAGMSEVRKHRGVPAHVQREERIQVELRLGWVHLCVSV